MFVGDLDKKTYEDVLSFLQEAIPEGVRLDYRRDFPINLEKTIAALANTEGGVILIGVEEDSERPRCPKERHHQSVCRLRRPKTVWSQRRFRPSANLSRRRCG